MGVHRERDMEAVGFVELLAAPTAKRRWSDEAKGRKANHLSSWRSLARKGQLVVPDIAGADFASPVAMMQTSEPPIVTGTIDLIIGPVTVRLDPATPVARIAELVLALRACP